MIQFRSLRDFGIFNLGITLVWFLLVGAGAIVLLNYETESGERQSQSPIWPQDSAISHSQLRPTLIFFAHPHCPCTRASVKELARILSICCNKADCKIVALDKLQHDPKWRDSDLVKQADSIPGVSVFWDKCGVETNRFHIKTSGHVVVFNSEGKLIFSGGITASRGHEGSNIGRDQVVSLLLNRTEQAAKSNHRIEFPVFGCALFEPGVSENE